MLTSRQPIGIGWGRELIYLYNDPYKSIIGGKHPWALGKPVSLVWREIWSDIEPMLSQAMGGNVYQNCQPIAQYILLIGQILVGGNEDVELRLSGVEQRAITQLRPAQFIGCRYRVVSQCAAKRRRRSLIKKYSHARAA